MAKLAFSKLGLKVNNQVTNILFDDNNVEIKQYLSINDKLKLISNVINNSIDEHSFCNPVKVKMFLELGIIEYYTNISFTEKQKEDVVKLYDILQSNYVIDKICQFIPEEELEILRKGTFDCIDSIYTYSNSAMGILDNMSKDYDKLNFDAETLREKLSNGENDEFLKEVLDKLG